MWMLRRTVFPMKRTSLSNGSSAMPISVRDAIDDLYRIAVAEGLTQSPNRLARLAEFCVQELAKRGLTDARTEINIPGAGRTKRWDVGWEFDGKVRLGITLKSLLRNLSGTVPNRIDDLMGEVANVQLHSPEIVVGYVMIFDSGQDAYSPKHGARWSELFRSFVEKLSGRTSPSWAPGMIEAYIVAEVDFREGPVLLSDAKDFDRFFDKIAEEARTRNPGAFS